MANPRDDEAELDPTAETRAVELDEVTTNHLSPMGQVESIGRFARGAGPERLTRWFKWGIFIIGAIVLISFAVDLFG